MYESMGSELRSPDHLREVYGRGRPGSYREANGHSLNPSSTSFAAIANKSARTPARGTPRGCRPACHTARADGETEASFYQKFHFALITESCDHAADASRVRPR